MRPPKFLDGWLDRLRESLLATHILYHKQYNVNITCYEYCTSQYFTFKIYSTFCSMLGYKNCENSKKRLEKRVCFYVVNYN